MIEIDAEEFEDTKGVIRIQKDKQRSTKHTHKAKDRVTRTPLKTGGELRCAGRMSSSCSTSGTRRGKSLLQEEHIRCHL